MADRHIACGAFPIPAEVIDFDVTGLNLPFTPISVSLSVRLPDRDADAVSAFLVGTPSASGFSVALSSFTKGGYILDWHAMSPTSGGEITPETPSGCDYDSLMDEVAKFLGYNPDALTEYEKSVVDSCVQSGVRNFYYPPRTVPDVDVTYEWSFLRQEATVEVLPDIDNYLLPDGFGRVAGQIALHGERGPMLPIVSFGAVASMRHKRNERCRPRFAAVVASNTFGEMGQQKRLHLYPCPDKAYTLKFKCDADTGKLSHTHPYPLGGFMFAELVIESCLACAEQRVNDENGMHTQNFASLLVAFIERDRKSTAKVFGLPGDPEYRRRW